MKTRTILTLLAIGLLALPHTTMAEEKAGEEREFEIVEKRVKMKFCWIPAGEAQLGAPKEEQDYNTKAFFAGKRPSWFDRESESFRGKFKTPGFWMGKYEVTQAQWQAVMFRNPSEFKGKKLPVEQVSWNDCQTYIAHCKVKDLKVQLPHEDQWEYACRGGKGNKQPFYWGDTLNGDRANCDGTYPYGTDKKGFSKGVTSEVGSYEKVAPHPWGLCDMHGNVREWCENVLSNESTLKVKRGGSWGGRPSQCLSAFRDANDREVRDFTTGFRLILVP